MPEPKDIRIWRGNSGQIVVTPRDASGQPIDPSALTWTLTAVNQAGAALLSLAGAPDGAAKTVTFAWDVAQSRLVPPGRLSPYEIEASSAETETTYFYGFLIGEGGVNTDSPPAPSSPSADFTNPANSGYAVLFS